MSTNVFVNLLVTDLARSKEFHTSLGWTLNRNFSDDDAGAISDAIHPVSQDVGFMRSRSRVPDPVGGARSAGELWDLVHRERAALAHDLATLTPGQWRHPSLCGEWTVEEVVAHLSAAGSVDRWRWIRSMLLAGLRPRVHNQRRLAEQLGASPAGTLRRFRAVVPLSIAPSSHLPAYLGEVLVHAQDIRRPLGIATRPGADALLPAARFLAARDFAVPSRRNAAGLRLVATDAAFAAGDGPEVRGTLLGLVMCIAGRPAYLDEVQGPGVPLLRARIGDGGRPPGPAPGPAVQQPAVPPRDQPS